MKKTLCIFLTIILLILTSCNIAEPIDTPEKIESPSESSPESPSTPIEEVTPIPEASESEPKAIVSPSESLETNLSEDLYKNYNMFLYGSTWSDNFNEDVKILTYNSEEYVSDSIVKEKSISYNGNNIKLTYQNSRQVPACQYDAYTSADGLLQVKYCSQTGNIWTISDRTFDISDLPNNEDECKNLIVKLIQKITGTPLLEDDYEYSCVTRYSNDVRSNISVPYFYSAETPDEKIYSYTFSYVFSVDEYKTTDKVSIFFSALGRMIISFDRMQFRNITNIDLEYEDAQAMIESFCRAHLSDDKEFVSVAIEDYYLTFIEDKMYLACSVATKYRDKESLYTFSSFLETILIEIE